MSELDHMDALAAEYVLGSLDVEERAQARNLLEADPTFAAKVELWERRFGELHLMVELVEPDSGIWARIKAKLPEVQQGIRPPEPSMPPSVPPASPSPAASAPPSLDAIEAAISQAATTLSAEASSAATQEAPLALPSEVTTVSEAVPAVASETASAKHRRSRVRKRPERPLSRPCPVRQLHQPLPLLHPSPREIRRSSERRRWFAGA